MSQGPQGSFPPGSFQAQQQRLFDNLPKPLQQAYMKEANGQGAMSKSEEDLYIHLADIHSRMEATNTFIEMVIEARAGKLISRGCMPRWRTRRRSGRTAPRSR